MLSSSPPSFDVLREHVEALIETGRTFPDVEREIDSMSLPEDHKAALWLFAWALDPPGDLGPTESRRPALALLPDAEE